MKRHLSCEYFFIIVKSSFAGAKISSIFIKQVSFLFVTVLTVLINHSSVCGVETLFFLLWPVIVIVVKVVRQPTSYSVLYTTSYSTDSFYSESIQFKWVGIYRNLGVILFFHELSKLPFIEHFFTCK